GPLSVPRAIRWTCQALRALAHAHDRGIVHRDVKPANLLVTGTGDRERIKLAGFDLARTYDAETLSGITLSGDIGGTIPFIAPEQITNSRAARPPVDQYAAAATLYNLLTGHYVYDLPQGFAKQLALVLNEDPVPIRSRRPDLPERLASVIHRALA